MQSLLPSCLRALTATSLGDAQEHAYTSSFHLHSTHGVCLHLEFKIVWFGKMIDLYIQEVSPVHGDFIVPA